MQETVSSDESLGGDVWLLLLLSDGNTNFAKTAVHAGFGGVDIGELGHQDMCLSTCQDLLVSSADTFNHSPLAGTKRQLYALQRFPQRTVPTSPTPSAYLHQGQA
jgi:hypothetical protein